MTRDFFNPDKDLRAKARNAPILLENISNKIKALTESLKVVDELERRDGGKSARAAGGRRGNPEAPLRRVRA